MYYVNVSSVQDFMQCRFRWWCKWVMNRVERNEAPALTAGKLLHNIFEDERKTDFSLYEAAVLRSDEYRKAMVGLDDRERASAEKAIKVIDDLGEGLELWEDKFDYPLPTLEVEEPFEISFPELPGVIFRGRPDRVEILMKQIWHIQNRGLAAGTNFGIYIATAKRHYHEHLYAEHLSRKYPNYKYGGTIFNLVRKLKYRTKVTKANPAGETKTANELFFQHPMSINLKSGLHKHVMLSLFQHVRDMLEVIRRWEEDGEIPAPNEKLNAGAYGNVVDPYFRVLTGEITLDDEEVFKDREDTYAPADALTGD